MHRRRVNRALKVSAAVAATAVAGSVATDPESDWYKSLEKPSWQPPKMAFPFAWTSLYALIAVSSTKVLNELDESEELEASVAFKRTLALNLTLNALWSWLFFWKKDLPAAVVGAAALAASSGVLAKRAGNAKKGLGFALLPYFLWTAFAAVLSATIYRLNR